MTDHALPADPSPAAVNESSREHLDHLIAEGAIAAQRGDVVEALRRIDRAWRLSPDSFLVAQFLGQLLLSHGENEAAFRHLDSVATNWPSVELEADLIEALLRLDRVDEAIARLESALRQFAVTRGDKLAQIAARVVAATDAPMGWGGITPELDLIGAAQGIDFGNDIIMSFDPSGRRIALPVERGDAGVVSFHHRPRGGLRGVINISAGAAQFIGSGLAYPPAFFVDGRATIENGRIVGWVSLPWHPDLARSVVIEDDRGIRTRRSTTPDPTTPLRRRFEVDPTAAGLAGNVLKVALVLPDGSLGAFPDSPLLLEIPSALAMPRPSTRLPKSRMRGVQSRRPVDVVVPVYGARVETLACLRALAALPPSGGDIIVIDDASPDAELARELADQAAQGTIVLLRNSVNRGFPASANRGLAVHPERDAVLLNADAVVHGDWLRRLQDAAYSAPDIGTVTPFTNTGSIASYPGGIESDCTPETAIAIDVIAAEANRGITADLPVGVGFCLYIRRDCLEAVGPLDEATFGSGYGEEVDFCLRAVDRGWRHILAADIFVHHLGARSFGPRRAAVLDRGTRIIGARYPAFQVTVEAFHQGNSLGPLRRRIDEACLVKDARPIALHVTLALKGGVERFVRERAQSCRDRGLLPLILKPDGDNAGRCVLTDADATPTDLAYNIPAELPQLAQLLDRLNIVETEFHHFLDLAPALIETVLTRSRRYDVYIHDYSWICPRITLIDGTGHYCGEPAVATCEACIVANGSRFGDDISVRSWRARSKTWLAAADRVVVPTSEVADRLVRYFPKIHYEVSPWETPALARKPEAPPAGRVVLKVALIGAIGRHKGFDVLLDCARDAAARDLPIEFVVIGYAEDDQALIDTGKVFVTGAYQETELEPLLRREEPALLAFFSLAPETWCYVLTEAMETGLPIMGFDFGAIGARLRLYEKGVVLPYTSDMVSINDQILEIGNKIVSNSLESPASKTLTISPLDCIGKETAGIKERLMPGLSTITAQIQILPVSEGLYCFSVRTAAPSRAVALENLLLPAVHIDLGPGVSRDLVEFLAHPKTNGRWLCEPGDMVIAKVSGQATILLSSLIAPAGQVLGIEVERLDLRSRAGENAGAPLPTLEPPTVLPFTTATDHTGAVRMQVNLHVRNQGDMSFTEVDWAGRAGTGKWIEAFSLRPLTMISPADLEYKGLTSTGLETPWLSNGAECGTRGKAMPLVGFAIRIRQDPALAGFDCEYSGSFQSGSVVGPLKNGVPCRSRLQKDALEGIQVRIVQRSVEVKPPVAEVATTPIGPRFSKLREEPRDDESEPSTDIVEEKTNADQASHRDTQGDGPQSSPGSENELKSPVAAEPEFKLPEPKAKKPPRGVSKVKVAAGEARRRS